jgi:hypothetical protein
MKQALISTIEPCETGYRVAQVISFGETFPVAVDLFWTTCSDDVVQDKFWYDPQDQTIKIIPVPPLPTPSDPVTPEPA